MTGSCRPYSLIQRAERRGEVSRGALLRGTRSRDGLATAAARPDSQVRPSIAHIYEPCSLESIVCRFTPLFHCSSHTVSTKFHTMQGNLRPVHSETHTVVLQLASITGVPSSFLDSIRSPCGHYRPIRARTARAALVHLPRCQPGPGGEALLNTHTPP